jgi:hypothetical protein
MLRRSGRLSHVVEFDMQASDHPSSEYIWKYD